MLVTLMLYLPIGFAQKKGIERSMEKRPTARGVQPGLLCSVRQKVLSSSSLFWDANDANVGWVKSCLGKGAVATLWALWAADFQFQPWKVMGCLQATEAMGAFRSAFRWALRQCSTLRCAIDVGSDHLSRSWALNRFRSFAEHQNLGLLNIYDYKTIIDYLCTFFYRFFTFIDHIQRRAQHFSHGIWCRHIGSARTSPPPFPWGCECSRLHVASMGYQWRMKTCENPWEKVEQWKNKKTSRNKLPNIPSIRGQILPICQNSPVQWGCRMFLFHVSWGPPGQRMSRQPAKRPELEIDIDEAAGNEIHRGRARSQREHEFILRGPDMGTDVTSSWYRDDKGKSLNACFFQSTLESWVVFPNKSWVMGTEKNVRL